MITFKPNGSLDISTDPTDLPDDGLARCKNLRLDRTGKVSTRDGSSKFNTVALGQTSILRIVAQGGVRYTFAGTVLYQDEVSIKTGLTNAAWSAILYNSYNSTTQNIFAINGTDRIRIEGGEVYEMGLDAPAEPTISAGPGGGNLTGVYNARYTYLRKEETSVVSESDPSPILDDSVTLAGQSLHLKVTAPTDSQVTHIREYRTAAGGSSYFVVQDIEIDSSNDEDYSYTHDWEATEEHITGDGYQFTTAVGNKQRVYSWEDDYTDSTQDDDVSIHDTYDFNYLDFFDNVPDGSLGSELSTTHDRAPLGSFIAGPNYNGYCFIIKDNLLYYCLPKRPEYWPTTYYIEVSSPQYPGKCVVFYNGQPYVLTAVEIYFIQGTGHNSFFPLKMDAITGTVNQDAAVSVAGMGILHIGNDGLYLFNGTQDAKMSQGAFEPIFRGETVNGVPGISDISNCWIIQHKNKVYLGYTSAGYSYPTNTLVIDLVSNRVSYYTWGNEIRTVSVDKTNEYLLAGDNSGFVWRLDDDGETDDAGTAISWELESKEFTLQTRAHFPRWTKYDVNASDNDCTATGELLLDGVSHQSHTLTGNRVTKRRLVATGNGERLSHRISGTGPVDIYMVESE